MTRALIALLLAMTAYGQPAKWAFYASVGTFAGGQVADSVTTLRAAPYSPELNPLGNRGAIIGKALVTPAIVFFERRAIRRAPRAERWFAVLNFGLSFEMGWAAWHNSQIRGIH